MVTVSSRVTTENISEQEEVATIVSLSWMLSISLNLWLFESIPTRLYNKASHKLFGNLKIWKMGKIQYKRFMTLISLLNISD